MMLNFDVDATNADDAVDAEDALDAVPLKRKTLSERSKQSAHKYGSMVDHGGPRISA